MTNNMSSLIEKYWNGDTSLEEESAIRAYMLSGQVAEEHQDMIPLFQYFSEEKSLDIEFQPDLSFTKEKKGKIRMLYPKIIGIAASFLLLLTVSYNHFAPEDNSYAAKYTEVEDPEEALAIAMEALGYLSNKYEKGNSVMTKNLGNLKKADIFK